MSTRTLPLLLALLGSLLLAAPAGAVTIDAPADGVLWRPAKKAVTIPLQISGYTSLEDLIVEYNDAGDDIEWQESKVSWTQTTDDEGVTTATGQLKIKALDKKMLVRVTDLADGNCDPDTDTCEDPPVDCDPQDLTCGASVMPASSAQISLRLDLSSTSSITNGLPPLKVGMTLRAAKKATKLELEEARSGCRDATSKKPAAVLLFLNNRLALIRVSSRTKLVKGVGLNTSLPDAKALIPGLSSTVANRWTASIGKDVYVQLRTVDNRVDRLSLGTKKGVRYYNGCPS